MAQAQAPQRIPHVEWIDLHNDGVSQEVIVMSRNVNNGDLYFILISDLDEIDRSRILRVLKKRDADKYPLYDLLINDTLKNGMNALEFFHQLVKIRLSNGMIVPVDSGKRSSMNFTVNPNLTPPPAAPAKTKKS